MSIDVKSVIDNYGVKDIKTLEGIEAIRLRPGMSNFFFLMGIPL